MNQAIVTVATPTFVVAIDCAAPHQLARFWAAALHYEVENNHEQVLQMIELGDATRNDAVEIDGRGVRSGTGKWTELRAQPSTSGVTRQPA